MNGSPCVDAGIPDDAPATDIRGNERPGVDGKICMGAFESHAGYNMGSPRSPRRYYVKPDGDDAADGGAWDSPLRTIAAALDKVEGDDLCDIWVAEGDYPASPTLIINGRTGLFGGFEGIETIIAQRNIGLFRTTVSGQDSNSCFINNGVLDGLHITRGASAIGGGVTNYGTILNCEVFNNSAALMGGGIVNMGYVGNCKVRDNLVMNSGEWQYTGGGIFNQEGVIKNCEIHGNGTPYSGGGIYNYYGIVENCLVYDNEAISNAGGIDNVYGTVGNSTIAGNMVQDYNGGVSNPYKEGAVTNSIIWGNAVDDMEDPGNARFNCFREAAGENDNISSDPLFINLSGEVPTWDLKLQPDSPCIDRGTSPVASLQDIRGVRRPQGAGIDMGAYEWLAPEAPFMETIEDTSAFGGILFIGPAPRLVQGEAPIAWTLLECPTGMTIDEDTGVVSWSDPTVSPIPYRISIMARNSAGYDIKVWQLNVLSVAGWVLY